MTEPFRPLTPAQLEVAQCVARGWDYARIGSELGITPRTVRAHVEAMAMRLPNPANLPPRALVLVWMAQRDVRDQSA